MKKGQKFNLTKEQKTKLIKMLENNILLKDIAIEYDVSSTTISNYIKKNNLKNTNSMKTKKYFFNKQQINYIKKIANKGALLKTIANLMNVDRDTIKRIMKENNFSINNNNIFIMSRKGKAEYNKEQNKLGKPKNMITKEYNNILRNIVKEASKYAIKKEEKNQNNTIYLTDNDIICIKNNINNITIKEISKKINKSEDKIKEYCKKNGIDVNIGSKRILPPDSEEFNNDIANPNYSNTDISRKYHVSCGVAKRWRKERFGNFKTMINTWTHKSSAEIEFEEILEDLDIVYFFQKNILGWKTDFYLGNKIIIEINGSHWHDELNKVIEKDKRKINELEQNGYKVFVFWDYELKDIEKIKQQVVNIYYGSIYEVIRKNELCERIQSGVHESE